MEKQTRPQLEALQALTPNEVATALTFKHDADLTAVVKALHSGELIALLLECQRCICEAAMLVYSKADDEYRD